MAFVNIDARGQRYNRLGVKAVQRNHNRGERLAAAQARRDRRRAKRAGGPNVIVLGAYPDTTVTKTSPDGAYIWDGGRPEGGRWQIIVVGPLKGEVDAYRAAAAAWLGKPLKLVSATKMTPEDPADTGIVGDRGFLDVMLELDDGQDRGPIEAAYAPAGTWPNNPPIGMINHHRHRAKREK